VVMAFSIRLPMTRASSAVSWMFMDQDINEKWGHSSFPSIRSASANVPK
jgi:hypothetical protein